MWCLSWEVVCPCQPVHEDILIWSNMLTSLMVVVFILCTDAITIVKNLVQEARNSQNWPFFSRMHPTTIHFVHLSIGQLSYFFYFYGIHGQILHYCSYPNVLLAGHTTIPCHVGQLVHPLFHLLVHLSVSRSVNFLNCKRFLHCYSCPTHLQLDFFVYGIVSFAPPHMQLR